MKLSKIHINPDNPRIIKDDRFKKLVKSIKEFPKMMKLRPIIVDAEGMILGGNMRFKALKELGYKEVPAEWIKYDGELTNEEKQRFIAVDNVPFGDWDFDILANEWDQDKLIEWGLELPKDFGIKLDVVEDDYEIPDEIETDIVLGDLFEIGQHRLLCGDSTNSDQVERLMDGQLSDMVFTDPPYNIDYGNIKHPKFRQRQIENDNMSATDFRKFCKSFISNILLFNKGCVYLCGAPCPDGRIMFAEADDILHYSTVVIWNKDQFTLGRGKYQNKYEPIWFGWVDTGSSFYGDRKQTNVWDVERPKQSKDHPTMKPIKLISMALNHASRKGDNILDLFIGSGSTMVASHQLNRKCYGMEIDPKYCQVIIGRMKKLDPNIKIKKNGVSIDKS